MRPPQQNRRTLLRGTIGLLAAQLGSACNASPLWSFPPVRAITRGPAFHWFGYYDKLEFDPSDRYVLGMEVDFEGRRPERQDEVRVGMVDIADRDRWVDLGVSRAWNWQQGCMLQWIPNTASHVIWNDREGDALVARILDVGRPGAGVRTVPRPIYCLAPDGKTAFSVDFARLHGVRRGYGYAGLRDTHAMQQAPDASGIWRMDLETGKSELIYSIKDAARLPDLHVAWNPSTRHWLYQVLVSPDGSRLAFLHGVARTAGSFFSRLITTDLDGGRAHVVTPRGHASHYCWRDPSHLLAWWRNPDEGEGFFLLSDRTDEVDAIGGGLMAEDGHCSYLPDPRWILNDTYPSRWRIQNPYLFDVEAGRRYSLGTFFSPVGYDGEHRCDTHPRSSRDGRSVVIDSAHEGGRQMYLIDISAIRDSAA